MANAIGKWYGFDLDGTIADNSAHTYGRGRIGKPVKPMCDLMKKFHSEGRRVKIFTARLSDEGPDPASRKAIREHIWKWCDANLGFRPEITDRKDWQMERLYDDRAKQVVRNTGECLEDRYQALLARGAEQETNRSLDRVRGCLFGGAVGDALGYPVEFMGEHQIRARFGENGIRAYKLDSRTGKALISDDTQMTLFTATGLLVGNTRGELRGIMGDLWSYVPGHYEDWLRTQEMSLEQCRDELRHEKAAGQFRYQHSWLVNDPRLYKGRAPGMTCLSGLRTRFRGVWELPEKPSEAPVNDSKGCGGVMRVAPVGLYFNERDREAASDRKVMEYTARQAAEVAAFTHGNSLGYMPAAMLAYIVNRLAYPFPGANTPMSVREAVSEARNQVEELFAGDGHLHEFLALIDRALSLANSAKDDVSCIHELGQGWVGDEALAIAILCALRHENDFSAGIIAAVNHRGDSDSTGSITGNILGAHLGYSVLGAKWKENLELSDVILELADDLYHKCHTDERTREPDAVWMAKYGYVFPDYVTQRNKARSF